MEQGLLALLGLLALSHSTFSLCCPPSLSLAILIVRTPTEGHTDTPLNISIVADTPEGLHFDNRWSVSVANATTGCYSLSHHTPKGGYTRE